MRLRGVFAPLILGSVSACASSPVGSDVPDAGATAVAPGDSGSGGQAQTPAEGSIGSSADAAGRGDAAALFTGGGDDGGLAAYDAAVSDGGAVSPSTGAGLELWHPTVLPFASTGTYSNPYMQNAMTAVFTGPAGATLKIPGYYAGGANWAVRFSPTAVGRWTYVTQSADAGLDGKTGTIDCIANTNTSLHGALRVDSANPTHLKYEDGTQYFQLAYEADWLGLLDLGATDTPAAHAKPLIDTMSAYGFHEVLMQLFAYDTPWGTDPTYDFGPTKAYLWGGTNQTPVHTQINPTFFDRFDAVIDYLFQKGITAHLMFMVFNKQVNWPAVRSPEDAKWFQYVTARYEAYPNVVWDFAKETIGCYNPATHAPFADEAYVHERIALIKGADAYQRLRTAHAPVNGGATVPGQNYWFDVKPNDLDFYTAEAVQGTNIYANTIQSMARVGAFPYANDENSYQVGNDGTATYANARQSAADVHDDMMEAVMAGAGAGYYYAYHAWDDVRYAEVPAKIEFFKNLSDLFSHHVTLGGLTPDEALIGGGGFGKHCLARPGKEYVVELSPIANTTTVSLNVTQLAPGASLTATWYDLDLGAMAPAAPVSANGTVAFTKPFAGLGVLVIQ